MANIFRVLAGCLPILISAVASAQVVVYDNFQTDLGDYLHEGTMESGDQITLSGGTPRQIADFTFEYYFDPNFTLTTETARVRFYDLTGTPLADNTPTPGGLIWDSQAFALEYTGRVRVTLPEIGVTVPDTFVWTVEFGGGTIAADKYAGLTLYGPPSTGSNDYPEDFWQNIGGVWDVHYFEDGRIVDFGAQITAVPEPWASPIVFLACAALFIWRRRPSAAH